MSTILHKYESYQIINKCFEVHNNLGFGFSEIVYKDALELEFKNASIPFKREVRYEIDYKGIILPHSFFADFIVYDKIILEIKAVPALRNEFVSQSLNYLKVSKNKLALLINFGEQSLNFKRIIK
ncbi:MAG: GxxExxY protein [Bacteroidota bacterium]